ncbi:hypothetical protein P8C59_004299 [Phyllachora maydis]|uniref:Uncharacterized protein n=1 Tax=Phyllachora maydis TaxID=1825666 RepID=A0AAD9I357_9PEZI|nr:hypothetical protein P8C59_004299 [Phyllachora maydis]
MHLLRRSCRIEGRNADSGQSSRPLLPIRTLLEDKEDGEDYSEVIEVLKQHIKSHKRNISSTLASLTNSSNAAAATTGKTSYSPRFDPFSGTIDLDSPPHPSRKEPHLGPAVNLATSNLDPPIDTGSKEGFKDTITSSIVKELSKKAYTIPDNSKLSGESNFEQWIQALTNIDFLSNLDNSVYNILASIPAKPAKITPAIHRAATRKAKRRKSAKARAAAGRAVAAKRSKKEDLQRSKRTAGSNAGRYTTNSGLIANKDDNNAYNRAYVPPTNTEEEEEEEEEDGSSDNDSINSGISDGTNKGEGSGVHKRSKGALRCKDTLLYKR